MTDPIRPTVTLFGPFEKVAKQPDGSILVDFTVTTEAVDDQGEIVDYDAVKKAAADYMQWAALREMHQPSAVGTTLELQTDDATRKITGQGHVVDPIAVLKVESGVYKGVSMGGRKLAVQMQKIGGKSVRRITDLAWTELSLVDRPSNPDASLTLAKRSEEDLMGTDTTTAAPEAGIDTYTGPDGALLAKASDGPPEGGVDREDIPAEDFAGKDKSFPIVTPSSVSDAAASIGRAGPDNYSTDELRRRIIAIARRKGPEFVAKLPEAWQSDEDAAKATRTGDLHKSAADDVAHATMVLNCINELIESEAAEGETDDVAFLQGARAALLAFISSESDEVGTPEDVAAAEAEKVAGDVGAPMAEEVAVPMAYSSQGGDLAASTMPDRTAIEAIVEEVLAKRARATPEPTTSEEPPATSVDELLAKTTRLIEGQFGRFATRADVDAMKAEILEAVKPVQEDLAKIARMPAPGGPLRFALDGDRFADEAKSPSTEAEVLAKAARREGIDPHVREELGRLAAAAQIAAERGR